MDKRSFPSIVLLTMNGLQFTESCLASMFENSKIPFQLILVDNGSTDGTVDYLRQVCRSTATDGFEHKLICNSENRGFAAGCNQGIKASDGDHIILLNNDTVVPPGWLEGLISTASSDDKIGMVGPLALYLSDLVDHITMSSMTKSDTWTIDYIKKLTGNALPYSDPEGLYRFAAEIATDGTNSVIDMEIISGFCMLLKRSAVEKVGLLDEGFIRGYQEDADYTWRFKAFGFRTVMALGLYVHHHTSATISANSLDMDLFKKSNLAYRMMKIEHNKRSEISETLQIPDTTISGKRYHIERLSYIKCVQGYSLELSATPDLGPSFTRSIKIKDWNFIDGSIAFGDEDSTFIDKVTLRPKILECMEKAITTYPKVARVNFIAR